MISSKHSNSNLEWLLKHARLFIPCLALPVVMPCARFELQEPWNTRVVYHKQCSVSQRSASLRRLCARRSSVRSTADGSSAVRASARRRQRAPTEALETFARAPRAAGLDATRAGRGAIFPATVGAPHGIEAGVVLAAGCY